MYENKFESKDKFQKAKEMKINLNGSDLRIKQGDSNQYCHTYETNSEKIPSTKLYNENEIFEYEEMKDVSLRGKGLLEITVEDVPETITIMSESGDVYIDEMTLGAVETDLKSGDITGKNLKINYVDFKAFSGDVKIQGYLDSDVKINIQTKSGDIKVDKIGSPTINCQTKSGDIKLIECNSTDVINISSKSGDLNFDNFIEGKNITLKSISGDIKTSKIKCDIAEISTNSGDIKISELESENSDFQNFSGDVRFKKVNSDELRVKTESGSIKVEEYNVEMGTFLTFSGSIKILTTDEDYKIIAESITGEIKVFDKNYYKNAIFGESDREIKLRTESGSIKVETK
ncbi:MAG: hypothetical protein PWQ85_1174 [Geotoga sp.]|nr:hypothetical protein [Geotoga sp.]